MLGKKRNIYRVAVTGLLLCAAIIYLVQLDYFQVGMAWDDAQYVQLARSIANDRDYVVDVGYGETFPTRYPFGLPLILAAVHTVFPDDLRALQVVAVLFTLANIWLLSVGRQHIRFTNPWLPLLMATLYAFSPFVVASSRMVMSEPAFLFFVLLSLGLTMSTANSRRQRVALDFCLGIAWLFASQTRTLGITVLLASFLYLVLQRSWQRIAVASAGFGITLLLITSSTSLELGDTFNAQFYLMEFTNRDEWKHTAAATGLIPRALEGVLEYAGKHLPQAVVPVLDTPSMLSQLGLVYTIAWSSIAVLLLLLISVGVVQNLRSQGTHPVHIYLALYVLATVVWPFRGPRFLYGVLPFIFGFLVLGTEEVARSVVRRLAPTQDKRRYLVYLGACCAVVFISLQLTISLRTDSWRGHAPDLSVGAGWIKAHTAKDSIVVTEKYDLIYPYIDRATAWLPPELSEVRQLTDGERPVYVMIVPIFEWSQNGELLHSDKALQYLQAFEDDRLAADLVFEDTAAKVKIYRMLQSSEY